MVITLYIIECTALIAWLVLDATTYKKHGVMHFFKIGRYNFSYCKSKKGGKK